MTPAPAVLMLNRRPARALRHHVAQLQSHGYTVIACTEIQALCEMAAQYSAQATTPWIIILASSLANNCMAATSLRGLFPSAGILAFVSSRRETVLAHTLRSGADTYCYYSASAALLMATLHPLLARACAIGSPVAATAAATSIPALTGYWALTEKAWVLTGPQQQRMRLTTGERAFLSTLLAAPGLRANHDQLVEAVSGSYAGSSGPYHHARLTLLVSRLRRKFRAQGGEAPLRSVHRWGYMFTAPAKSHQQFDALPPVTMYR